MSGVLVGKRARISVEHRVEESYKLSRSDVCTKKLVQLATNHLRRCFGGSERAKRGLQIRHEQRRRDPFSCDIADANADAIFVELNDVEVVAPDLARWLPRAGDLDSSGLRQSARQQQLLDLARPLEFLFLLLQRDGPFLDGLLQHLVAFFQLS